MEKTKDELEIIKLKEEISNLKRPFFLRPEFLSIVLSSLFAAFTIWVSISQVNKEKMEQLKTLNIALDNKLNDFDRKQLEVEKASLISSIEELKVKENNLKDSLFIKYNKDLLEIERNLEDIFNYTVEDYSIEYANTYVKSESVTNAISDFVVNDQKAGFRKWLYSSTRRAIDKSNNRSMEKVLDNIGFELKLNQYKK